MEYPTREAIRSRCTEQSFERGRNYYHEDRIQSLDIDDDSITATVRGSRVYDVEITLSGASIHTWCSCPYDYAGDCKHIIAVLLVVNDRDSDDSRATPAGPTDHSSDSVKIEAVVDQLSADELREFLCANLDDHPDLRDQLVAFAGEDTEKTIYDYKQELDRLFDDAAGRGGMITYNTHIDFAQYFELAETHSQQGRLDVATNIYRALAETICENMPSIDDSTGYYGDQLAHAIDAYATTVVDCDLNHEEKQPYIDYLFDACIEAEYHFASEEYDEALRTICTTDTDLEYWLGLLDDHVSGINLDPTALEAATCEQPTHSGSSGSEQSTTREEEISNTTDTSEPAGSQPRDDDVLAVSDFTDGPLNIEDFTGGVLDIEHLAVDPLQLQYFVGETFETLRVDEPTTIEEHTVTVNPREPSGGTTDISSSLRTRQLVSTGIYILSELDEDDALHGFYEQTYLEDSRFCKQYAEQLRNQGDDQRAIEVIEDGITTFSRAADLQRLAADLYADQQPEKRRSMLKQLFLEQSDWEAYDALKAACAEGDCEWEALYEEFEQQFRNTNQQRLIELYIYECILESAFTEIIASEKLSWFQRYRDPVARVDSEEYFEEYREQLIPFAAGDTGRRHYREIIDHLEEMEALVPAERFENLLTFLTEKHSNRPAFLDEMKQAGLYSES